MEQIKRLLSSPLSSEQESKKAKQFHSDDPDRLGLLTQSQTTSLDGEKGQPPSVPDFDIGSVQIGELSVNDKLYLIIGQLVGLTAHCKGSEESWKAVSLRSHANTHNIETVKITMEEKVRYFEGRTSRLEDQVAYLANKVEDLEYRSKRENILIYGLPTQQVETTDRVEGAKTAAISFFVKTMKCDPSKVKVDIAHRIESRGKSKNKPLVVYMETRSSKNHVMSNVRNLVDASISVSEQLPKPMQERRLNQLGAFKKLRSQHGKDKVKLVRDKLILDGKIQNPRFEQNTVKPMSAQVDADDFDFIQSDKQSIEKSQFWGYSRLIETTEEVQESLAKLLEDEDNANSTHIVYAYKLKDSNGQVVLGNCDDREVGASKILLDELTKADINAFIAVVRVFGGKNLGAKRFEAYRDHAKSLMKGLKDINA